MEHMLRVLEKHGGNKTTAAGGTGDQPQDDVQQAEPAGRERKAAG